MARLSLIIAGAGIGGLTAALALADRGHDVLVLEKRTSFSEAGAGIQLSPNASRILIRLGLENALERAACKPTQICVRDAHSGKALGAIKLGDTIKTRFGAPYYAIARHDLHMILLDAVRAHPHIRLFVGRTASHIQHHEDHIALEAESASGIREPLTADCLIGADGIWSTMRGTIGDQRQPIYQGYGAWRASCKAEHWPSELPLDQTGLWLGRKMHMVHYAVDSGRHVNIVLVERLTNAQRDTVLRPNFSALSKKAAPLLQHILESQQNWCLWPLYDLPIKKMADQRIALLGDAAHPILPFLAQGGALAIEDAACLADHINRYQSVPEALKAYEQERLPRITRVQNAARRNGRLYHARALNAWGRNMVLKRTKPETLMELYAWLYEY
jgi:salicylate hydroxylase